MTQKHQTILLVFLALFSLTASSLFIWQYQSSWQPDTFALWNKEYGAVVDRSAKSVVAINVEHDAESGFRKSSSGSGMVISKDGYILTNEHVIAGAERIRVTLADKRQYVARLIGFDIRHDLAILKIEADGLLPISFADPGRLKRGDVAIAIGNPLGTGSDGNAVATFGFINRLEQKMSIPLALGGRNERFYDNLIQTSASVTNGNSGGPLVNELGQAAGIITASSESRKSRFGFAIALDEKTRHVIDSLKKGMPMERGFLGVELADSVDRNMQIRLGIDEISGAVVTHVMLGFPAQRGGVENGDLIKQIDGQRIASSQELISYVDRCQPEQIIYVNLLRGDDGRNQKLTLPVRLSKRSDRDIWGYIHEKRGLSLSMNGMVLKPLIPWRRQYMDLPADQHGVLVFDVDRDGPARQYGIEPGAIITHIGHVAIYTLRDVELARRQYPNIYNAVKFYSPYTQNRASHN